MNINIHTFAEKYAENYHYLYSGGDRLSDYPALVAAGDEFLSTHQEFVSEFARYRGDILTSDREIAAFMLTLQEVTQ